MPKVSVIIPTHNRPELIGRAIQSVLNQSYQDFEIIVIDDGLKIRAESIIKEINDSRITYIHHDIEKGGAAARNTGIKVAKGEYIAFLDDDDEWLPDKLEKQAKVLEGTNDSISACFCGVGIYDKQGYLLNDKIFDFIGICQPYEETLRKCFIWTSAFMYKKVFADKGFIFDETLKKNQEWDLQLRLLKVSKFYSINEKLVKLYDQGDEGHMGAKSNVFNMILGMRTFINNHFDDYIRNKSALALRYMDLAKLYNIANEFKKARFYVFKAWKLRPYNLFYFRHLIAMLFGKKIYTILVTLNNK